MWCNTDDVMAPIEQRRNQECADRLRDVIVVRALDRGVATVVRDDDADDDGVPTSKSDSSMRVNVSRLVLVVDAADDSGVVRVTFKVSVEDAQRAVIARAIAQMRASLPPNATTTIADEQGALRVTAPKDVLRHAAFRDMLYALMELKVIHIYSFCVAPPSRIGVLWNMCSAYGETEHAWLDKLREQA